MKKLSSILLSILIPFSGLCATFSGNFIGNGISITNMEGTNVHRIPNRVFNVMDQGAIPNDGLTDQTNFQATIDIARNAGGGTVYFPHGRYEWSTNWFRTDLVEGAGSRLLLKGVTNMIIDGSGSDIIFTNHLDQTYSGIGVLFCSNIVFRNFNIYPRGQAVDVFHGYSNGPVYLQNIRCEGLGTALDFFDFHYSEPFHISQCWVTNVKQSAIQVIGGKTGIYPTVSDSELFCTTPWPSDGAIAAKSPLFLKNVLLSGPTNGIVVHPGGDLAVENCQLIFAPGTAGMTNITLMGGSAFTQCQLSQSGANDTTGWFVYISNAVANVRFSDCTLSGRQGIIGYGPAAADISPSLEVRDTLFMNRGLALFNYKFAKLLNNRYAGSFVNHLQLNACTNCVVEGGYAKGLGSTFMASSTGVSNTIKNVKVDSGNIVLGAVGSAWSLGRIENVIVEDNTSVLTLFGTGNVFRNNQIGVLNLLAGCASNKWIDGEIFNLPGSNTTAIALQNWRFVDTTNGLANGSIGCAALSLSTNVTLAVVDGVYTNLWPYNYTFLNGKFTASTNAITNLIDGVYNISANGSKRIDANQAVETALFTNGVECPLLEWHHRVVNAGTNNGSASLNLRLPANTWIEMRFKSVTGNQSVIYTHFNLNVIGPL